MDSDKLRTSYTAVKSKRKETKKKNMMHGVNRVYDEKIIFGCSTQEEACKWVYLIRWLIKK